MLGRPHPLSTALLAMSRQNQFVKKVVLALRHEPTQDASLSLTESEVNKPREGPICPDVQRFLPLSKCNPLHHAIYLRTCTKFSGQRSSGKPTETLGRTAEGTR